MTEALPQTHRLKECVAPVLSVLTECARMHRPARKFLKAQVLGKGDGAGEHRLDPLYRPLAAPSQHLETAASPGPAPSEGCEDSARGGGPASKQACPPHDTPGYRCEEGSC